MKVFVISLLGIIFVTLITSSVPSIAVDDSINDEIVFEDANKLNVATTEDLKYKIYLHVLVRNAQGELITVAETLPCKLGNYCSEYKDHEVTDYAFDILAKKEIITINNIKYEKIQFSDTYRYTDTTMTYHNQNLFDLSDREPTGRWVVEICGEALNKFGFDCVQIFQSRTSIVWLEVGDVTTANWTILKKIN
tara:strand:+ start:148 stop:726 length:579 start_codon:yes stop_codon:yes gene_type:complete